MNKDKLIKKVNKFLGTFDNIIKVETPIIVPFETAKRLQYLNNNLGYFIEKNNKTYNAQELLKDYFIKNNPSDVYKIYGWDNKRLESEINKYKLLGNERIEVIKKNKLYTIPSCDDNNSQNVDFLRIDLTINLLDKLNNYTKLIDNYCFLYEIGKVFQKDNSAKFIEYTSFEMKLIYNDIIDIDNLKDCQDLIIPVLLKSHQINNLKTEPMKIFNLVEDKMFILLMIKIYKFLIDLDLKKHKIRIIECLPYNKMHINEYEFIIQYQKDKWINIVHLSKFKIQNNLLLKRKLKNPITKEKMKIELNQEEIKIDYEELTDKIIDKIIFMDDNEKLNLQNGFNRNGYGFIYLEDLLIILNDKMIKFISEQVIEECEYYCPNIINIQMNLDQLIEILD